MGRSGDLVETWLMNAIKDSIRTYILTEYLPGESPDNLANDTPLRTSGILDSMATLNLVNFLESTFGISIDAHETGIEHFDRIEDIAALVARKQGRGA
jgi:acyl carrier protein